MKKVITIIVFVLIVAGAAAYFLFLAPPPEPKTSFFVPGDHFVTNIKDSTRLLKVTIVIELSTLNPEETKSYLTERSHIIRDVIVFLLRSKTEEELRSNEIQNTLRGEIVDRLKSELKLDYIKTIYFNDYVIQ
ncbi:MAG: flagellar basal body-associated FliL family protein [Christensenellales bacterium]